MFLDIAALFFRCCSTYFSLLQCMLFNVTLHILRCCSIYIPMSHCIVFPYVCTVALEVLRGGRTGCVGNEGQGCGGERRTGTGPVLFRSIRGGRGVCSISRGGRAGFGKEPTFKRTPRAGHSGTRIAVIKNQERRKKNSRFEPIHPF